MDLEWVRTVVASNSEVIFWYAWLYFPFSHNGLLIHLEEHWDVFIIGILLMYAMAQQIEHIFLCKYIIWI
jgi:hypothetical protein